MSTRGFISPFLYFVYVWNFPQQNVLKIWRRSADWKLPPSLAYCSSSKSSNFFKCFLSPELAFGSRNSRTPSINISSEVLQEGSILPTGLCNSQGREEQKQGLLQSRLTQWNPLWESMGAQSTSISSLVSSWSCQVAQGLFSFGDEKNKPSSHHLLIKAPMGSTDKKWKPPTL